MIALLRVLMALCSLTTAAHFLRFGTLWDAVPCVLPMTALAWPRILPRPLLCMAALGGALLWVDHAANLVNGGSASDSPGYAWPQSLVQCAWRI